MIYIIALLYTFFLVYKYDIKGKKRGLETHYKFLWLLFTGVAGLSYHVGGDSIGYEEVFDTYQGVRSFNYLFKGDMFANSQEPLWILINMIFSSVFGDFMYLKLSIAIFFNSTVFWFIKKHSTRPFFSILLYAVILYLHLNFQVLRESVGISLFLIAFDKICGEKKNYKLYFALCLVAAFTHRFSFITFIIPALLFIKMNVYYYVLIGALLVAGPFINNFVFGSGLYLLNDTITSSLDHFLESDKYQIETLSVFGIIHTFIKIIPLWVLIYFSRQSKLKSLAALYVLLFVLNAVSVGILYRINDFLLIPFVVVASESFANIQKGHQSIMGFPISKGLLNGIILLFLATTISSHINSPNFFEYYPYSSVFTREKVRERENLIINMIR